LRCQISQEKALRILNEWAGQPLPLSASSWIGSANSDGQLTIRLAGAAAAVSTAPVLAALWFGLLAGLIIEVKTSIRQVSVERLQSVAEEISRHTGWRFLLVTLEDIEA
jgi:hypothetical protein